MNKNATDLKKSISHILDHTSRNCHNINMEKYLDDVLMRTAQLNEGF